MIKRVGKYELGKVLGEGSFGKVRQASDSDTGEQFAIKILDKGKIKQDNLIENLRREIQIMKSIEHPNIVKLYQVLSSHSKIYLVLELVTGGELFHKLTEDTPVSEDEARFIFQQIVSGINFCENQHIAHRDLKLENILLDENGTVKISDFGLSGLFSFDRNTQDLMHTTCGTINYLAPEVFGNQGYDGHVADLWSCGVILYALLTKNLPFEDDNVSKLIEQIVSGRYEMPKNISVNAQDLLNKLLNVDPRTRIHLDQIKSHPWFAVNYVEPCGKVLEPRSSVFMPIDDAHEGAEPKAMNAFELLNFCAGLAMNRMFDASDTDELSTYFISTADKHLLADRLKATLEQTGLNEERKGNLFKMTYSSKIPPLYTVLVEIREILESFYIVVFTREKGGLMNHKKVFQRVKNALADLIQN